MRGNWSACTYNKKGYWICNTGTRSFAEWYGTCKDMCVYCSTNSITYDYCVLGAVSHSGDILQKENNKQKQQQHPTPPRDIIASL